MITQHTQQSNPPHNMGLNLQAAPVTNVGNPYNIRKRGAEFTFLKEKTNATAGNLSVQIQKLKEAGYIDVIKQFKDNYPQTICRITPIGVKAFETYVNALQGYLGNQGS